VTTERLDFTDSYLTRFDASVVDRGDGGRRVYLDRTAFYPTSGGQPCDFGRLEGIRVADVIDEGDRIGHLLDAPLAASRVQGEVDWTRRFDHMQQHTGQHLLSAVFAERFGSQTVSVHFGQESSTLDLDREALPHAALTEAEAAANAVVTEDREVTVSFEDAKRATGLRRSTERTGMLRIVTIAGLDRSACGGTHVRRTGEIGPILIRKAERVRKQLRLEFLCGGRATTRARLDLEVLSKLAALASSGFDDLAPAIEKQAADLKRSEAARRELESLVYRRRASDLYHQMEADAAGRRVIIEGPGPDTAGAPSIDALRSLAQGVVSLPGGVLLGASRRPPTLLIATSEDSGLDAARLLKTVLEEFGGRGGGSPRIAQGTLAQDRLDEALARARACLIP